MLDRDTAFLGAEVGLEAALRMKERRSLEQRRLVGEFGVPLVSFSVVMPGPVKRNAVSALLFRRGRLAVSAALEEARAPVLASRVLSDPAGDTALWAVDRDVVWVKLLCVRLEDGLSWGRLLDIDTIDPDGIPVSRKRIGREERGCLVCGRPGPACARSRAHSLAELLDEVWRIAGCMS